MVKDFISERERDSTVMFDTDTFIPYFLSELRSGGLHVMAQDLAVSLNKVQSDQEKLTKELLEFNDTRFAHLRNYVNAQFSETAELQNIVDTLQSTDS